jgi:hypothetical protein
VTDIAADVAAAGGADVVCLGQIESAGLDLICKLVRQGQDALQPIEKARRHLVVFILLLQELDGQALPRPLIPKAGTNPKSDFGNTEGGLCDAIQLK